MFRSPPVRQDDGSYRVDALDSERTAAVWGDARYSARRCDIPREWLLLKEQLMAEFRTRVFVEGGGCALRIFPEEITNAVIGKVRTVLAARERSKKSRIN